MRCYESVTAFFYFWHMAKISKRTKWRFEKLANSMEAYYHQLDLRSWDEFDDEAFEFIMQKVKGVNMLDLNELDISNASIALLPRLEYVKELRIKGCRMIDNRAIPFIREIRQLEFLHAKGTGITIEGLLQIGPSDKFKEILFSAEEGIDISEKMSALIKAMPFCKFVINGTVY